jgi:hypothetical protein
MNSTNNMNSTMVKFAKYGVDGQIQFIGEMPEFMLKHQQDDYLYVGEANAQTQYIYLETRELRTYTALEQVAKDNCPVGWTWCMPQRKALDLRSPTEKQADAVTQCRIDRVRAYPPLSDLADALVHQSMGNEQPLQDYLAACRAVKENIPKPNVA